MSAAPLSSSQRAPFHAAREIRQLTRHTYVLRMERNGLVFRAGQCLSVGVPGSGVNREYSIYSGEEEPFLDILVREVPAGVVSPMLRRLRAGDPLIVGGPYSNFVLDAPADAARRYLLVGTGTGIAPFHAFTRTYPDLRCTILHGIRAAEEQYDRDHYADGTYVPCISRPASGRGTRVTDHLRAHPPAPGATCYLCGNRAMIAEAYDILRGHGVPSSAILSEVFF